MSLRTCPDCGCELPPGLPEGSCPHCLLKLGLRKTSSGAANWGVAAREMEQAGGVIGHYKLIEPIGEGGFGVVWMAEQQEPVRRRVALKIIKLGMDTKEVVARFAAERQALALMDHPNIARVFDGGATENGRPYFVMELVRGERITDFCDARQLGMEARLQLFIQVCQAVQHAHQKGVIHRDLKPSNILVTEQEGRAVPKVIDFGVAKAIEEPLTDKTLFTRFHQFIGTPAYMSPEQAGWGGLDIDTRSDLYALGVLLYELLTGRTPFANEELLKAGLDQVLRVIREKDPPKPSTQLSTLTQADLRAVAERRAAEPAKLNRLVRGDLDWIVMRCLEKDRTRRYETVNGLARDIERHLNNEPVVAAAPSLGYAFTKFASRHRVALATGLAFVFVLIGAAFVSTWQAVRANRAAVSEKQARMELLRYAGLGYFGEMNLAADAIDANNLSRARQLLEHHRPKFGDPDFRHWEWSYLLRETRDQSTHSMSLTGAVFNRLGIAPDGKTLAVPCGRNDGVQLWDTTTRQVRGELPVPCFQAFFSPNSKWVAAVVSQQGRVDVFNAETSELVASLPRDDNVNDVVFSPDESLLAITADNRRAGSQLMLRLWRWRDKTLVAERGFPSPGESFHFKFAFHPDGKRLAIGERQGGVRLLRTADLGDEQILAIYDRGVGPLAISADGRWLAGGVDGRETTIYVWDLQAGTPPTILRGHSYGIFSLSFSSDSRWLASGAGDQSIKVWELPRWRLQTTLRGHRSDLRSVGFLGDTQVLASGDVRGEIKLWDLRATLTDTNDLLLPPMSSPQMTAGFDRFAGISTNRIAVSGATYPTPASVEIPELGDNVRLLAMSPGGDYVAAVDSTNTLRLWRRSDGHVTIKTNPHPASLSRMGFVKQGEFLVSITEQGHVQRWSKNLEELRPVNVPANFAYVMLPTNFILEATLRIQEADFVFCNTLNGRRVMSLEDGGLLGSPMSVGGDLGGSALSRDGRLFAIGNQHGQVEVYDTATWQRVGEPIDCHRDWLWRVAFSPDGRRLVTSGSGREPVRVWDVESRQQICTLPIEPAMATLLQFSADGRSLAFGTPSGQVRIVTVELPD